MMCIAGLITAHFAPHKAAFVEIDFGVMFAGLAKHYLEAGDLGEAFVC
jgi:hypothetical protein